MGFKINNDEELVNRFKDLEERLNRISSIFKNGDEEVSRDVWDNYLNEVSEFKELFYETISIADDVFKLNSYNK